MAALTSVQQVSLLLVLGVLALSGCAVICTHSAAVAVPSEGIEVSPHGEGVTAYQVCICSPKVKGQNRESPDCQCTDLSILDKLLSLEETASTAARDQADVSIAGHQSAEGNASKELGNSTETAARVLSYKSPRAAFFEHFSPFKHTDKSLAETSSPKHRNPASSDDVSVDSDNSEESPLGAESTMVATREESPYHQKHQNLLNAGSRAGAMYRHLVYYLRDTPWSVALLSVVMTLSVSWGVNKLLTKGGSCKDLSLSDGCPQCQLRHVQIQEYAQRRLEGKRGVPSRPAASDRGPRVPVFDSDDEGVDPSYAPELSQESSSDWDSDESSGESCEMLL